MFLYCNNVYVKRDYYNAKIYILVVRFAIVSLLTSYRIAPPPEMHLKNRRKRGEIAKS